MRNLIAFPVLILVLIIQSSVVSQIRLISGYADLLLLTLAGWALQENVKSAWHWAVLGCIIFGFVSKMPWLVFVFGYLSVILIAQILQRRVWHAPLLAMFSVTFAGTLLIHGASFAMLRLLGTSLEFGDVLGAVTLPSLLLNMLFSIPIYNFMHDLSMWVYPPEEY
jgi:hypothetical protein